MQINETLIRNVVAQVLAEVGTAPAINGNSMLFLADTLAREIDDFARVFEETLAAVESC